MIDDLQKSGQWKMHLTMKLKFLSSTDINEKRIIYSKSDNSIVMIGNDADTIIQEVFELFLHKYQKCLKESMKGSNFIFDHVSEMHYICNKIRLSLILLHM